MELSMRRLFAAAVLLGALALPGVAAAQSIAYAVYGTTNMRAGPGTSYPVIAKILGGSAVHVYGCIPERVWCDAQVQGVRGWVNSNRLEFVYGGRRVPLVQYYGYFGVPYVHFDFGYWDRYYRYKPWYRDRDRHFDRPRHNDRDDGDRGRGRDREDRPRDRDRDYRRVERPRGGQNCDGQTVACLQRNR
jgi:uncharacterized protein YraI